MPPSREVDGARRTFASMTNAPCPASPIELADTVELPLPLAILLGLGHIVADGEDWPAVEFIDPSRHDARSPHAA